MIKRIIAIAFLMFSTYNFAQRTNSSPYSFFGIGDQAKLKTVEEIAMGQMGGVLDSEFQLSFTNPASYGSLLWTTYVFSGGNKTNKVNDGEIEQTSSAASLTYIAIGIPIRGNQGMAAGLQLNSAVGYSLLEQLYDDNNELNETNLLSGNGGTSRLFLGYGYKFPFNLNLGAEVAYIFGGITNTIVNRRAGVQLATENITQSNLNGVSYKFGAQYTVDMPNNMHVKLGTTFNFEYELQDQGSQHLFTIDNTNDGSIFPRDTIRSQDFRGTIKYPLNTVLSAGIGQSNKWFAGVEYTFAKAVDFDDTIYSENSAYEYINSNSLSVGGFFTPKYNSIASYWNRVTYRAGFVYKNLGLVVNDTEIDDIGISFGVSLPLGLKISNFNLGFELGKRGTTENNLILENYYNFRLSISLNDKWFGKRRIH
jgi:hypothetical protein